MVKKSSLAKKLGSYSVLASSILAVEKGDAQVIGTHLNPPDSVVNVVKFYSGSNYNYINWQYSFDTTYLLDLNNDGIADFQFTIKNNNSSYATQCLCNTYASGYSWWSHATEKVTIAVQGIGNNMVDADTAENYGAIICSSRDWKSYQALGFFSRSFQRHGASLPYNSTFRYHRFKSGAFSVDSAKLLPLRFSFNNKYYYGWVRLTIDTADTILTVSSYAYNSIPKACIAAGDSGNISTAVSKAPSSDITIWAYNREIHVQANSNQLVGSYLNIYSIFGNEVFSSYLGTQPATINFSDQPPGVYLVKIKCKQSTIIKKVVIE